MHPRLRFWLIVTFGVAVSVMAAFGIADQDYSLAVVAAGLIIWVTLERLSTPRPEAWALAAAVAGFILANRGFAQLSLSSRVPLLPAELALIIGAGATLMRVALRQTTVGLKDALNIAVLTWVLLGTGRIWMDFRAHGAMALRDFAMVYYATFFFIAQTLAAHAPSARLLRTSLLAACAILPLSYLLFSRFEEQILQLFTFRGTPLVFYKDDLVAAYLVAGMFLFLTVEAWPRWLRLLWAALAYGSVFTIASSRAALVGLLVTSGWWVAARRWTPLKLQAVAIPVGIAVLGMVALVRNEPLQHTRIYTLYEHVASMVDFTGGGQYSTEARQFVGDNNRFRIVWWRTVADETVAQGPWLGLGFGYDLAAEFARAYYPDSEEAFAARSPHSILFTVFGRMGAIGLAAFLVIIGAMFVRTIEAARAVRRSGSLEIFGWWSVGWVLFTSACFGVVLEGPMGAMIFWTALGMANGLPERPSTPEITAASDSGSESLAARGA